MFSIIKNRIKQGYKTSKYPLKEIMLPEKYRGLPSINKDCEKNTIITCAINCPTQAINASEQSLDLGRCVFCGLCEEISDGTFIKFTRNYKTGASDRRQLTLYSDDLKDLEISTNKYFKKLFGRSLQIRQVSAGGCNACEADLNVLNTPFFDISRFGIQFVASPRHADAIMVTGPITRNMKNALIRTFEATPNPKIVIASGTCSISGGIFRGSSEQLNGLDSILKADLYIPGCPPHPLTVLHSLLKYLGIIKS